MSGIYYLNHHFNHYFNHYFNHPFNVCLMVVVSMVVEVVPCGGCTLKMVVPCKRTSELRWKVALDSKQGSSLVS